jgi:hypothetical protein
MASRDVAQKKRLVSCEYGAPGRLGQLKTKVKGD